ncbi:hypothetical protein Rhal01_00594 [Rubritalea halochordaticola]|uniref:Uncharacterized protein n=1 Tax=Rubritalea halochordaticola TaxID=714537 RepID=A0ABP9UVE6_9BACT
MRLKTATFPLAIHPAKSKLSSMLKIALPLAVMASPLLAQVEEKPDSTAQEKENPAVVKINVDEYQVGLVKLNKKTREVSLEAKLEHRDVLLEYLLTNPNGKIHETLFVTDAVPSHINIALKLIGYKESLELFRTLDKHNRPTEKYHEVDAKTKAAARFTIHVAWEQDGKQKSARINELIQNEMTGKAMTPAAWVYGGSYVLNGQFKPDASGDIIAIFTDRSSIANYSGTGREDDTIWKPFTKRLPETGTKVTITFKPYDGPVAPAKQDKNQL